MTTRRCEILHTSDIHLDNRVGVEDNAGEAGLQLVVDKAIELEVNLFLLVGDLFDHNRVKPACLEFATQQLSRVPCPVVMITGNHDCMTDYSIYHRYNPVAAGNHIHFLKSPEGEVMDFPELGVRIWGKGIVDHYPGNKPMEAVPDYDEDHWYIGMAHGYYTDRGAEMFSSLITPAEIEASNLHYLALGHVHVFNTMQHGRTQAAYAGSPNLDQGARERTAAHVTLCPDAGVQVNRLVL